jgi:hypothetical protein
MRFVIACESTGTAKHTGGRIDVLHVLTFVLWNLGA